MKPNPFASLAHSRKFWLLYADVVGSLVLYFAVKYAAPSVADDVKFVIAALQPVFLVLIGAIVAEDNSERDAQARIAETAAFVNSRDNDGKDDELPFA